MKVLHIGEYVRGGVATYIRTLIKYSEKNVENYLLLAKSKSESDWSLNSEHIIYYNYKRNWRYILPAFFEIRKAIKRVNPDIVYIHSTWAGVLVRSQYLWNKKPIKIIYNAHGWSFLMDTSAYKKKLYAMIECVLAYVTDEIVNVSNYEYNAALNRGISPSKQNVIYSGISSDYELSNIDSVKVSFPKDKLNLLFVGRFDNQKGVDFLIEEFNECNRDDIHLILIGDNVISGRNSIEKVNTKKITFLGWIPHDKIAEYYVSCDAIVMPSRWEAFGLVAIEAMKYGKPVIASNRGALPEIVSKKEVGFVFSMDKKNSLTSILECLDKDSLQAMNSSVREEFLRKYTADNMVVKTYNLYEKDAILNDYIEK